MKRYAVVLFVIFLFGAFSASAQEVPQSEQTDPTNCGDSWMYIQNKEVWEIAHTGWEPSFYWGASTVEVDCIGTHLLALTETDEGYVIVSPETLESDILAQFESLEGKIKPDGVLFQVSQDVLWFSGETEQITGVFGLYQEDDRWYLIYPFSNWRIPEVILGITVDNRFIPEAVETSAGVYYLVGVDVFIEGASALNSYSSICPADVDQPGCIMTEHFHYMGVPETHEIIDFAAFGALGRDFMLEVVTPSGAHEVWVFDQAIESFAPVVPVAAQ